MKRKFEGKEEIISSKQKVLKFDLEKFIENQKGNFFQIK
jgi:hypothetical protein